MTSPTPGYTPTNSAQPQNTSSKSYNKHMFVWVFAFLLGGIGCDRFFRGQISFCVAKLAINLFSSYLGFPIIGGIWPLVDLVIAIYKAYFDSYKDDEYITFVDGNYSK